MSVKDDLLAGNARFVEDGWDASEASLTATPSKQLAVVACMDTRYNVERVLGLGHGDAKIIRNAGNAVDEGTIRSLVVAVHLLGVEHVAVVGHSKCGMSTMATGAPRIAASVAERTEATADEVETEAFREWLGGFEDVEAQVRAGVERIRAHRFMPDGLDVFGLLYDNDSGEVRPVG